MFAEACLTGESRLMPACKTPARARQKRAENPRLKAEMEELKSRINQLSEVEGAVCPVCGQPPTPQNARR
jgi:DNA repair exonuclease SbcCD ATPase subunit